MSKNRHHNKVNPNNRAFSSPESESSFSSQEGSPSYEEIQKRAYEIYQQKGGSELDNWLEAEQSLKHEQGAGRS